MIELNFYFFIIILIIYLFITDNYLKQDEKDKIRYI